MRDLWITLGIFPILFGIPLLIIQVVSWLIKFLKKEKISCPFFLNKQIIRLILILSAIIGFASSLMVSKSEYETQKFVNFISGKSFHLKEGAIVGVFVFIIALLGLWSIKVFFNLAYIEINNVIKNIQNIKIVVKKHKNE